MSTFVYCPGCNEVVADDEPCECVFVARGTVDADGILHTARRVPVDDEPAETHYDVGETHEFSDYPFCPIHGCDWLPVPNKPGIIYCPVCKGNIPEPAEFPHGEFDDGAHWRQPAAQPKHSRQDWLTERGGEPEDWLVIDEPTGEDSERDHLALCMPQPVCWSVEPEDWEPVHD